MQTFILGMLTLNFILTLTLIYWQVLSTNKMLSTVELWETLAKTYNRHINHSFVSQDVSLQKINQENTPLLLFLQSSVR